MLSLFRSFNISVGTSSGPVAFRFLDRYKPIFFNDCYLGTNNFRTLIISKYFLNLIPPNYQFFLNFEHIWHQCRINPSSVVQIKDNCKLSCTLSKFLGWKWKNILLKFNKQFTKSICNQFHKVKFKTDHFSSTSRSQLTFHSSFDWLFSWRNTPKSQWLNQSG